MTWLWKAGVVLAVASLASLVGWRELASPIGAPQEQGEHAEENGHDEATPLREAKTEDGKLDEKPRGPAKVEGHGEQEGLIKLTPAQIEAAQIATAPVAKGTLVNEVSAPGRVTLNLERQAKVVPKVAGTVAAVNKRLGEVVAKGEILATIESREIADAKAEYLEAWRSAELSREIFVREERLWQQKVSAEQDFLNAKNVNESAKLKLDLAHQKLHTLGLEDNEIETLVKDRSDAPFRTSSIRAPISGQVTASDLVLGQIVNTDKDVFTIADLSNVWVELAIPPQDVVFAGVGQDVRIESGARSATGKIVVLSPVIDAETRSAKAIAEIDNKDGAWKLGDFVTANLISDRNEAGIVIPRAALQTIKGQQVVFVSEDRGFEMRPVTIGRQDSNNAEVTSGLKPGESIATKNTFTLKAELGKAEAEHED